MLGFSLQKQIKAAAIQCEAVHEDISAGAFRAFSNLNATTKTYYNQKILDSRGNFFAQLQIDNLTAHYVPLEGVPAWEKVAKQIKRQNPDFIWANTFQRDGVAKWMTQFDTPILGIVHNPDILKASEHAMKLVREGRVFAYGLAPHVVAKIVDTIPELQGKCEVYNPFFWMDEGSDAFDPDDTLRRVLIPGAVDYKNRDYLRLMDHLSSGSQKTDVPIRFEICTGGPDRNRLEADIASRGLENHFHFAPLDPKTGRVPHAQYLNALHRCDAVMLLIPQARTDYLKNKLTTGVAAGFGAMRPIIAPEVYGRVYGFPALSTPADNPMDLSGLDLSAQNMKDHRRVMAKLWKKAMFDNQVAFYKGLVKSNILKG